MVDMPTLRKFADPLQIFHSRSKLMSAMTYEFVQRAVELTVPKT